MHARYDTSMPMLRKPPSTYEVMIALGTVRAASCVSSAMWLGVSYTSSRYWLISKPTIAVHPLLVPVAIRLTAGDGGEVLATAAEVSELDGGSVVAGTHSLKMKSAPLRLGVMAGRANMTTDEIMISQANEQIASWLMRLMGRKFVSAWKARKPIMIPKKAFWNAGSGWSGTATPKLTELMSPSAPGGVPSLLLARIRRMEVSCCAIWNSYDVMPATKAKYSTQPWMYAGRRPSSFQFGLASAPAQSARTGIASASTSAYRLLAWRTHSRARRRRCTGWRSPPCSAQGRSSR